MGKPSVNRGKITSTDNTHPTSQNAKQIPDQHNAQNKRHIAERFSARAVSDDDEVGSGQIAAPCAFRREGRGADFRCI
jgi:hypothetical protein